MDNKIHAGNADQLQNNVEPLTGAIQSGDINQAEPKGQAEANTERNACDLTENALVVYKTEEAQ